MDPVKVLRLAAAMGGRVDRLLLVGCEPEPLDEPDDMQDGLSEPVRAAVDEAVPLILSLAARLLRGEEHRGERRRHHPREGGRNMSRLTSERSARGSPPDGRRLAERPLVERERAASSRPAGLLIAGVVVVGVGLLAWTTSAPT